MADADARGDVDLDWRFPALATDRERTAGEVGAVVAAGDGEGEGEFAGTVGEVTGAARGRSAAAHEGEAGEGFQATDENASGRAVGFGNDVQALVHAVDQVDVGVAGRSIEDARARGEAAGGVGSEVGLAEEDER